MQTIIFYLLRLWHTLKAFSFSRFDPEYRFNRQGLDPQSRKPGISGFMRLRNEQDFLIPVIDSTLPYLDELIIVYNRSRDHTPEIIRQYQQKFPDKVKVFEYRPYIYQSLSRGHFYLAADSPHSSVNYINYALSKTTRKIAILLDGDELAIPQLFKQVADKIRKNGLDGHLGYARVNLWDEQGEIFVCRDNPIVNGLDHRFFPVSEKTFFVHRPRWWQMSKHQFKAEKIGILFFHLKGMKKDRGLDNYQEFFSRRPLVHPPLMTWQEFKNQYNIDNSIPAPETLGVKPIR